MSKIRLIGLLPVLSEQPKVLILGSMPSVLSLETAEYYGNPRNHFWKIIQMLFEQEAFTTYEEKIQFIKNKNIALWDTIGSCARVGSLDQNITDETPNDIAGLLRKYPSIQLIACNGTKSYQVFHKYMKLAAGSSVSVIKLPSTSPIPGRYTKTIEGKLEDWQEIIKFL